MKIIKIYNKNNKLKLKLINKKMGVPLGVFIMVNA